MKKIVIFISSLFIGLFIIFIINSNNNIDAKDNKKETVKIVKKDTDTKELKKIKVDIKGLVNNPGVYEIDENSRVIDVINISGGLMEGADTDSINLSKILKDEDVIVIYSINDYSKMEEEFNKKIEYCNKDNNDSCVTETISTNSIDSSDNNIININIASIDELTTLPGIGEEKAKKIVEYRDTNGLFSSIEDIKNISGIGDNIFDKIKELITI